MMFTVLENFPIRKHGQAMVAPSALQIALALTRHFDNALPEPHGHDCDSCSVSITERNGDWI